MLAFKYLSLLIRISKLLVFCTQGTLRDLDDFNRESPVQSSAGAFSVRDL